MNMLDRKKEGKRTVGSKVSPRRAAKGKSFRGKEGRQKMKRNRIRFSWSVREGKKSPDLGVCRPFVGLRAEGRPSGRF